MRSILVLGVVLTISLTASSIKAESTAPPVITSPTSTTGIVGLVFNFPINATNSPLSFNATNLPPGLIVDSVAGRITGTPLQPGTFISTISATNNVGTGIANVTITISIPPPPVITSPNAIFGFVGRTLTYMISATNNPSGFTAANLPLGLALNTTTGVISGTPLTTGVFSVRLNAINAGGTGSATLTVNVSLPPLPIITSANAAFGTLGQPFSFTILATNLPNAFSAIGLPPGLSIDTATGVISGIPSATGTLSATISAINAGGTTVAPLLFTINLPQSPVINSLLIATGTTGVPFAYTITATNNPTSFSALGLPPGLQLNSATGAISGTPLSVGTFSATINAKNAASTATANLQITIINPAPPVITNPAALSAFVGVPFSFTIIATNNPVTFGATGLPPGLALNSSTGVISGVPGSAGVFPVTISATNAGGAAVTALTFNVTIPPAPVITGPTAANAVVGQPFSTAVTATNSPFSFAATGLPAGISIDTTTGTITGVPVVSGTFTVSLSATNAGGTGTGTLTLLVTRQPLPVFTSAATAVATIGVPFTFIITATGNPIQFGAIGLPAGLNINPVTGAISGVTSAPGIFPITISATNTAGTSTATLTLTVSPPATPVVTTPLTATAVVGQNISIPISTTTATPASVSVSNLPAGLAVSGETITGTPTAAGTFMVTLTAGADTQTLVLTVNDPADGLDSDGDGFPDAMEIALGSSPTDPSSTPFGISANAPLQITHFALSLNFAKSGTDKLVLSGALAVPQNLPAAQSVVVYAGGIMASFTLDANGRGSTDRSNIHVSSPVLKNSARTAVFSANLSGDFAGIVARSAGLTDSNSVKVPTEIDVIVLYNQTRYFMQKAAHYTSRKGKTGVAR